MQHAIKNVAKAPIIARYMWFFIMIAAMMFADQWGVAKHDILHLFVIAIVYGVTIEFAKRVLNQHNRWVVLAGFMWDLLAWSLFIYYSGGAANPLITLFLTVIAVASIVLSTAQIIGLSVLSIGLYSLLWYRYVPLTISHHAPAVGEKLHLLGMYGVFIFAAIMLTALTVYFKHAISRSYQALEQAQQAIHQQRRLLAVSSLAANIAHEMSTPIASMQMLTDDIVQQLDDDDELYDDVKLLQSQIAVCRQSLDTLKTQIQSQPTSTAQPQQLAQVMAANLQTLLPKVIQDWQFLNPHVEVALATLANPILVALNEEQLYAICINLLNNAMQAQATLVTLTIQLSQHAIICIEDNGQGIDQQTVERINRQTVIASNTGWGLGLTIAKTVLEYAGGSLEIASIETINTHDKKRALGTRVNIILPFLDTL